MSRSILLISRWHPLSFCVPPSGFAGSVQHTYQECFYARKWHSRAEAFWRVLDLLLGRGPRTICPPVSPKSTFRWCLTRSQFAKYVLYLYRFSWACLKLSIASRLIYIYIYLSILIIYIKLKSNIDLKLDIFWRNIDSVKELYPATQ